MSDFLRCIKCKTFPCKPYECFQCGYLHCLKCLNISDFCVSCKKPSKFKLSKLAEVLISSESITCKFCSLKLTIGQLKSHKYKDCPCAVLKCVKVKCEFSGSATEMINHIKCNHEQELVSLYQETKIKNVSSRPQTSRGSADSGSKSVISPNSHHSFDKKSMKSELSSEKSMKAQDKKDCCIF